MKKTRILCLVLCALWAAAPLYGCRPASTGAASFDALLANLEKQRFPAIYELLSKESKGRITLNEMSDRFESLYGALDVTQVRCQAGAIVEDSPTERTGHFTLTLVSDKMGEVTFEMTCPLVLENDRWLIDWTPSLIAPGLGEGDRVLLTSLPAHRGEIFDVNGNILAKNDYAQSVYVDQSKVTDPEALVRMLAPLVLISEQALKAKLPALFPSEEEDEEEEETATPAPKSTTAPEAPAKAAPMLVIKAYTDEEMTPELKEALLDIPGVGIEDRSFTPIRTYPYGQVLSHVLGYTGPITAEDLENNPGLQIPDDRLIGRAGLEKWYNEQLTGVSGWRLSIVDESGRTRSVLAEVPPRDGYDLHLSIDINLQIQAELQLMEHLTADMTGSVVVLDPDTGFIEAIASYPSYDPNAFTLGISHEQWAAYNDPKNKLPLFNRAVAGLYPPGSTFKPFTAGMALESGVIDADYVFEGKIENNLWVPDIPSWVYPGIRRHTATRGTLNLVNCMASSDNIYFASIALRMGGEDFYTGCQAFGFDRAVPSDLPVSSASISNSEEIMTLKDLADSGYGQGELLISPLQMAVTFASLGNGGVIYSPKVVSALYNMTPERHYEAAEEFAPEPWLSGFFSEDVLDTLEPALRAVVSQGTARAVDLKGLDVHAKTGTAQIGADNDEEIAWIVAYTGVPYEQTGKRRLVCVTMQIPADTEDGRSQIARALLEPPPAPTDPEGEDGE